MEPPPSPDSLNLSFLAHVQRNILDLRDNKELCDFIIQIGQHEFYTHKVVLAACSDYFRAMFKHEVLESKENRVTFHEITSDVMKALLDFIYTSKIELNEDNVQDILLAAHIMQIEHVLELCIDYIKDNIDTSNCLGILMTADKCDFAELNRIALSFCLDHFECISEEEEFLSIDEECLIKLISNSELNVSGEEKVFEAVISWIDAKPDERVPKLETLLRHVRLTLIEPAPLVAMSKHKYVKSSLKCRDLLSEAKDFILLQGSSGEQVHRKVPNSDLRIAQRRQQRIYSVGGWTNDFRPIENVEKYNPYLDTWTEVENMKNARCGVGVAILGNYLYAIGGHNGAIYLKSAERFNISTETWDSIPDMKHERTSVGVVELGGYIYAIGGQSSQGASDVVERYNPKDGTWEDCPSMSFKRLGAGVTVLNDEIIVVGGSDVTNVFNTAECYRPGDKEWRTTEIKPMNEKRKHLGCGTYDGCIYAIGGRGENNELDTAECYINGQWEYIPPMSIKRSGIGLVELDGLLYAIGGHNGDKRLNLVEVYNPKSRTWSPKTSMIHERLGGGSAVYKTLINSRAF